MRCSDRILIAEHQENMNILIVKMSAIGDVIHALPAVNALRAHFPDAHITWLVEEAASDIVESHEAVDRVLISKRKHWINGPLRLSRLHSLKEVRHFVGELRDTTYDLVIDFQGLMKSAVMVGLCRAERKIGYDRTREFSYLVLDERIPPYPMDKHAILRYLHLVAHLGVDTRQIVYNLAFGEKERSYVRRMLNQRGWNGECVVAVNAMAKWKTKLWNPESLARLANMLVERLGCFVVFTGSRADEKAIRKMTSSTRDECISLAGQTNLKELAALFEVARCVVSIDTGPMHLAAAMGTPVVALFGPTAPWRTGPFGEGHQVLRAGASCSPCFEKRCESVVCMREISVEQVFDSVIKIPMKSRPKGSSHADRGRAICRNWTAHPMTARKAGKNQNPLS